MAQNHVKDINDELYAELKAYCARRHRTLQDVLKELVEEFCVAVASDDYEAKQEQEAATTETEADIGAASV